MDGFMAEAARSSGPRPDPTRNDDEDLRGSSTEAGAEQQPRRDLRLEEEQQQRVAPGEGVEKEPQWGSRSSCCRSAPRGGAGGGEVAAGRSGWRLASADLRRGDGRGRLEERLHEHGGGTGPAGSVDGWMDW